MIDRSVIQRMTRNEADMAFKKRVETIFEWIDPTPDKIILDMPCGRGFYLNMFDYATDSTIIGADLDWDVLLKAQSAIGKRGIAVMNANIYALPYAEGLFDGVIYSEVLEHVDDDQQALREAYRVLKPGGVLAITVPHANYPFLWDPINKTLETLFHTHIQHGMLAGIWANHVRLYTMEQLRQQVGSAGFVIEQERRFTHDCFPFIHNLVYGIGMPLLESGLLPNEMATAANRMSFDENTGSLWNPINIGLKVFNFFDRHNTINEAAGVSTVNLAMKGRKPYA